LLQRRLDEPLKVAIAGRVKAGKSTLLNALVGERLAPTDAGECTTIVTSYHYSDGYDVACQLSDGSSAELRFRREDGRLQFELDAEQAANVQSISVGWPSSRLRALTLIDTPGIESVNVGVSAMTESALIPETGTSSADAVIYLLRHVHRSDIAFLETFVAEQSAAASPISAVAVLSRADEIGAGRLDALASARAIAARYEADTRLRAVVSAVVPVAGLLAETATTLEEREADALRQCASADDVIVGEMLRSVDHFRDPEVGPITAELRELLLQRFGLFGVRLAVSTWREGRWRSGPELARLLLAESGLPGLEQLVRDRFGGRARHLVSRSVLNGLHAVLEDAAGYAPSVAASLQRDLEELEASTHEFAELRMLDLVLSGDAGFSEDERREAERVTMPGSTSDRVGLSRSATSDEIRSAAIAGAARWRDRSANVIGGRPGALCSETLARSYEGIYAEFS
jgi:hypothetical protein